MQFVGFDLSPFVNAIAELDSVTEDSYKDVNMPLVFKADSRLLVPHSDDVRGGGIAVLLYA